MNKVYYELIMTPNSPFRIGGGGSEETDSDILLDGRGAPFIPGSSLAGVLRAMIDTPEKQREFFGDIVVATENNPAEVYTSRVLISDGVLTKGSKDSMFISRRDGVGLDEWGMAITGAKYDFQVAEVKGVFRAVIEFNCDTEEQKKFFDRLMARVVKEGLMLGARTSRGYGRMSCEIRRREFTMPNDMNPHAVEEWLEFRVSAKDAFDEKNSTEIKSDAFDKKNSTEIKSEPVDSAVSTISINLRLNGSLSIRVKEANAVVKEDGTNPDDVTIRNYAGSPIIPGTAWAGAFRHHMMSIGRDLSMEEISEDSVNRLFGKGKLINNSTKSLLFFTESVIQDSVSVTTTRNSIDRFTAAPINAGLFTNESCYGGETELIISFRKDQLSSVEKQLLAACITDLHLGLLSIGGGAGIGKGILEITKIMVDDTDKTEELKDYSLSL